MGVTVQVVALVPTQVPPVQVNDVAAGVQLAKSVELPPALIEAGAAVKEQDGGCNGGVTVTVTVAEAVLPLPTTLAPLNV